MKKVLRELLRVRDLDAVADLAARRHRTLGVLTSLTYDADARIAWRAVEAMGVAAARIAEDDPDAVRQHLRKLHWLLSEESGGIGWRAPEAMAEIVRRRPAELADYVPLVALLIRNLAEEDLGHLRGGTLWAVGRLAEVAGEHVEDALPAVMAALDDDQAQVRGLAAWCLGELGRREALAERDDLLGDDGTVALYVDGQLRRTTVGRIAQGVLHSDPRAGRSATAP